MPNWSSWTAVALSQRIYLEMSGLTGWQPPMLNFCAETCIGDLRQIATANQTNFQAVTVVHLGEA